MRSITVAAKAFIVTFALVGVGCSPRAGPTPTAPLAAVFPVPEKPLPKWISEISPRGETDAGAQIRIRFTDDVVPLEALEAVDKQTALAHVKLAPDIPGRFIFLTPRMIGFQADAPVPLATRLRVRLEKGLTDLRGHALTDDYAWTFQTKQIELQNDLLDHPPSDDDRSTSLTPDISVTANVELDETSLVANAALVEADTQGAGRVALVRKAQPSPSPTRLKDAAGAEQPAMFRYLLTPARALEPQKTYQLRIGPDVRPARGNLATDRMADGWLRTRGPLRFVALSAVDVPRESGGYGRFVAGAPQLRFTNDLDEKSTIKAISVSPAPNTSGPLFSVNQANINLNADALMPNTRYTVTVAADVKDQFGQTLGERATATFTTSDLAADFWAPDGFWIYPAGQNIRVNVDSTNLFESSFQSAVRALGPSDLIFADPQMSTTREQLLRGRPRARADVRLQHNREVTTPLDVRSRLNGGFGMLVYTLSGRTNEFVNSQGSVERRLVASSGAVGFTNIGLFAQWFPAGGIVRTHHLSDGSPIAHARIEIYESQLGTSTGRHATTACAAGETDASGSWLLDGAAFGRCASLAHRSTSAPSLLVIAREGSDWTFARTSDEGGQLGTTYSGWSAGEPAAHGTIFSDRALYQPGETVYLTAVGYFETNGILARGRATSYGVMIESPSGTKTSLGAKSLDEFGAFSVTLTLKNNELGYYSVRANAANGEILTGSFRVAEFKPPNFSVAVALDKPIAIRGGSVTATAQSKYLFGAPLTGKTHWNVTRERTYFTPQAWESFSFGPLWSYPEEPPTVSPDVVESTAAVGAGGENTQAVAIASDLPYPMTYVVEAQATDVSNQSVVDAKTLTVLPSDTLIGLKGAFVAEAEKPFSVEAIVVDPAGKLQIGKRVRVTLQAREIDRVTQVVEGSETPHDSVRYRDIATQDAGSEQTSIKVTFTAPKAGEYRLRANLADSTDTATATDLFLWVTGPGETTWGSADPNALTIHLDKPTYKSGETATALIESPYPEAELYIAVIRHEVMWKKVAVVQGAAPRAQFAVTAAMLPNAVVQAVLVRRGSPLARGVPKGLDRLARVGFVPFAVDTSGKSLKLTVAPHDATAQPGARTKIRFHLADLVGRATQGEIVLAVVNDAVLQLTGYRFPDLLKLVYADQPISTRFGDNRVDVRLAVERRGSDKGYGFGGGAEEGAAGTRIRTNFKPIAYYNGALRTDAGGDAEVEFALPDDLTTWRVLAVAMTRDARFGRADGTFLTTKALMANAIAPQFARPGDRFQAGVSVTNAAKAAGQVAITGNLGGGLDFVQKDAHTIKTELVAPIDALTQAYRFEMEATGTSEGRLKFTTKLAANSDGFEVPLPIRTDDVVESVVQTGATKDRASVPLAVEPDARTDIGGLDVTLASTVLGEVDAAVAHALRDDFPFATSIGGRIGVAASAIVLDRLYRRPAPVPALQARITMELTALRRLTLPDGGFAAWPGATRSEIFSTAFVATALMRAKAAGATVDGDLERVRGYLRKRLAQPCEDCSQQYADEMRLEALETLGTLGEVRNDFLSDIFKISPKFSYYERVELARHLVRLPGWRAQGIALRDKLLEQLYETGRRARVNDSGGWIETPTSGQAQVIGLMLETKMPIDRVDRAVHSLLGLRRNGTWGCACEAAEAMDAVAAYAALQPTPPKFTARAAVSGAEVRASFSGYATTRVDKTIPSDQLPRGRSAIALSKDGEGTLHYTVAYRYALRGSQPGTYSGIRIDRFVRAANSEPVLASFGLGKPAAPVTLGAARVFEIEDRIITDHPLDDVVITDPLPAGLEAIDASFQTASVSMRARSDNWQISYQQIYRDHVLAYAVQMPAGVYAIHYLVRSVTPGDFAWPGASVALQYAPEEFGRTASARVVVTP